MICTIGNQPITASQLWLPWSGAWSATVESPSDTALTGQQVLLYGTLSLLGTVDPERSGTYNNVNYYRIVGGYNGWGKSVTAKTYHNDLGVKFREVLTDLGNACGEKVTTAREDRLSVDYLRPADRAGLCLLGLVGRDWYVDPSGQTIVGARQTSELKAEVQLLKHETTSRMSTVFVEDLAQLPIGSILRSTPKPQLIRSIHVQTTSGAVHIAAEGRDL